MRKKLLVITLTIPLIFSACASSREKEIGKEENFKKVLISINSSAEELSKKTLNIDERYSNWIKEEEDYTKLECEKMFNYITKYENGEYKFSEENQYDYRKSLTYEEAKEDVDMLFKLFRNCYAGYRYFGGDEVFSKAKESIFKGLEQKKQLQVFELQDLIFSKLDFLKDYHTNYNLRNKFSKIYFMCKDVEFFKGEKGYYKIVENKPYYISQINKDKDINKFMKLTINKDGKLVYTIAIKDLTDKNKEIVGVDVDVEYLNDKNLTSEKIKLKPIGKLSESSKEVSYTVNNNIGVCKLGRMYNNSKDDKQIKDFIESGKKLKDYSVGIIDLRSTGGGDLKIGEDWLKNYSGEGYRSRNVDLNLNSNLIKYYMEKSENENEWNLPLFELKPRFSGEYSRIKNKNVLFVLVDKLDVSASEIFIENLKEMDNVILVGSNTGGCFTTGAEIMYSLKNSKIPYMLGKVLHVTPYSDEFEFDGFQPDIVMDTSQALDRVQKLISYYKLNEKK